MKFRLALPAIAALLACGCASKPAREEPLASDKPGPVREAPGKLNEPGIRESCRRETRPQVAVIDETRRRLAETVCGAALWFDGLFGEGDVRSARATSGRVEIAASHSDYEGWDQRVRFNARVRVPSLEGRVSAFVGRDNEQDFLRDRTEGLGLRRDFPRIDEQDEWLAGLGYSLPEAYRVKVDFKAGAHGLTSPTAFLQARIGYTPFTDDHGLVHMRGTPFVNTFDGFGFTSSLDLDRLVGDTMLVRWGSIGTVSQKSRGLDWRSAIILYQNLRDSRALAYEVFLRGATKAPVTIGDYGLRTIYRQPLVEERLIGQLSVGYSWPKDDPARTREGSFSVSAGLTLPFGGEEDPPPPKGSD